MNNQELDVLMLHCVRIASLRKRAFTQFGTADEDNPFSEIMNPVHRAMWFVLRNVFVQHPEADVSLLIMQSQLGPCLAQLDDFRDYNREAANLLSFCYSTPSDQLSVSVGGMLLQQMIVSKVRTKLMTAANLIYQAKDIDAMINTVRNAYVTPSDEESLIEPFLDIERHLEDTPRVRSGMDPLDKVANGGPHIGTVNGLLGPTGGGKTMTTMQILTNQARAYNHCLVLTYEQPVKGDVAHRICSSMLRVDIDLLRKPFSKWEPEHQEQYIKLKPEFGPYMHIVDMTRKGQGCRGIIDLEDAHAKLVARNQKPIYIIVDWLKPCIDRFLVAQGKEVSNENFRNYGYAYLDQLGQFARTHDAIIIINHQLNTDTARMSPKKKPVVTDAMEMRGFSFNIDACFLLGNRDRTTHVTWLLTDKNRRGPLGDLMVKMNGPMARFEEAKGYVADHRGNFVEESKINVVPDALAEDPSGGGLAGNYMGG